MEFKAGSLKKSSLKEYNNILSHLQKMPTRSLGESTQIIKWVEDNLTPGVAKLTVEKFSACCNWAMRRGAIASNPFKGIAREIRLPSSGKKIDPFTHRERDLILKGFQGNHYLDYVRFLFLTGCRPSEAVGLQGKHLYLEENHILFAEPVVDGHREATTKNHSIRRFPMSDSLRDLMGAIAPARSESLVFSTPNECPITLGKFREKQWLPVLAKMEIRYRIPYNTRHTFITDCIRQGIPITTIAEWVGNSPNILLKHYAGFIEVAPPQFDF
jgi:integrase